MLKKAVVFDFDGVIINSTDVQRKAFFESYKMVVGEGNPCFEEFLRHSGDSLPNIFRKMNLPLEMVEPYREISRQNMNKIKVYEGMKDIIRTLKAENFKCALCTGKDRARTIEILKNTGLYQYFDAVVCSDDVSKPKPHGESLTLCMTNMGVCCDDTVMIGDAKNDIHCARSVNVKSIAVTWGDTPVNALLNESPDYVAYTIDELRNCINDALKNDNLDDARALSAIELEEMRSVGVK